MHRMLRGERKKKRENRCSFPTKFGNIQFLHMVVLAQEKPKVNISLQDFKAEEKPVEER